jgi:hypothetical protein
MGARLHYAAFHDGENELSELIEIGADGEAMHGILQALADGGGPAIEVGGDLAVDFSARRVDFKRETPDGASEGEVGHQDFLPIAVEQQKYAFDGILTRRIDRTEKDGLEICQVPIENGIEKVPFTPEEEVETAAVGTGFLEYLCHSGGFVSLGVEEFDGGEDDAVAGGGCGAGHE